jgi:hypothetical protein
MTGQAVTLTACGKPASPPSHSPWKTLRVSHRLTASTTSISDLTLYRGTPRCGAICPQAQRGLLRWRNGVREFRHGSVNSCHPERASAAERVEGFPDGRKRSFARGALQELWDPVDSGLLVRPRRPSVAPSAWSRGGGLKDFDHADGTPAASHAAGTAAPERSAARVARQRHCEQLAWPPGGCTGTMPCPARPGERCFPRVRGRLRGRSGLGPGVLGHRPSGPPPAAQRRTIGAVVREMIEGLRPRRWHAGGLPPT